MKYRRLLAGLGSAVVLLVAPACGGSAEGVAADLSADNFAAEVASATQDKRSTHVEATIAFQGQTMTMTGDVESAEQLEEVAAQIRMEVPQEGTFEMRIVDGVIYLNGKGLSSDADKPWVKVDLSDSSNPLAGFYEQLAANANPAQSAKMFKAITQLENKGEEQVDGVDATRYEVTVDLSKALELSGISDGMGMGGEDMGAHLPDEVTYDVWLETDTALMVRMAMEMQGMEMDMHFSDWGEDVSVETPPAAQVTELDF